MNKKNNLITFIIYLLVSILAITFISSFIFLQFSERHIHNYRRRHIIEMAKKIEKKIKQNPDMKLEDEEFLQDFRPTHEQEIPYPFSFLKRVQKNSGVMEEISDGKVWLINEKGSILSSTGKNKLSFRLQSHFLSGPDHHVHSLRSWTGPSFYILKLKTNRVLFLVLEEELPYFDLNYLFIILGHAVANTTMAMLIALTIVFIYLRKKAFSAAKVMSELESGNLKARFQIGKFDEFTNLLCNFNRMADEIERLVVKLRSAESTRAQLIQELGHDLKTPLTSLMMNSDTLMTYYENLSSNQRNDVLSQLKSDILYFNELIQNLTEVASLDEPSYKLKAADFNLKNYLTEEIKNRQNQSSLNWVLDYQGGNEIISADPHLIDRLFRNAFDNSVRFAKTKIFVKIKSENKFIKISIMDDGPGLSSVDLNLFAKRRERRKRREGSGEFSLGFGSIIMKSIVELHGGTISISNLIVDYHTSGSCLEFTLPIHKGVQSN